MIETRTGEKRNSITLNRGEWCFYHSANGVKYSVHNVRGSMQVFKPYSLKRVPATKAIKAAVSIA